MLLRQLGIRSKERTDRPDEWEDDFDILIGRVEETRKLFSDFYKKISSLSCEDDEKKKRKAPIWAVKQELESTSRNFESPVLKTVVPQMVSMLDLGAKQYANYLRKVDEVVGAPCIEVESECKRLLKEAKNLKHIYADLNNKRTSLAELISNTPATPVSGLIQPNLLEKNGDSFDITTPMTPLAIKQKEVEELTASSAIIRDLFITALQKFQAQEEKRIHILVTYLDLQKEYHQVMFGEMELHSNTLQNTLCNEVQKVAYGVDLCKHLDQIQNSIAYVLRVCTHALLTPARVREEGLFRVSPNKIKGDNLISRLNLMPKDTSFLQDFDANTIAYALKNYFGRLPQLLLCQPDNWQKASIISDSVKRTAAFQKCIESLPQPHQENLAYLCHFLHRLTDFSASNRMDSHNFAVVFAPNLLGISMENQWQITVVKALIEHSGQLFPPESSSWISQYTLNNEEKSQKANGPSLEAPVFNKPSNLKHSQSEVRRPQRPLQQPLRKHRAPPPPVLEIKEDVPVATPEIPSFPPQLPPLPPQLPPLPPQLPPLPHPAIPKPMPRVSLQTIATPSNDNNPFSEYLTPEPEEPSSAPFKPTPPPKPTNLAKKEN